ncbi:acetolactate decarboxylase [Candidatus Dependentiae bacterium]|nr:acetolactate decarboxylase [Candidatus Dependentiae bacterium]
MKKNFLFIISFYLLLTAATCSADVLCQISTIYTLLQGEYDGLIEIRELLKNGNTGIGTFHKLDGEMIMLDGIVYQVKYNGYAVIPDSNITTPLAVTTNFNSDKKIDIANKTDFNGLSALITKNLPSSNIFYMTKITGNFEYIKTRSVPEQDKPYRPLTEVVKEQSVYEFRNLKGTIVAVYFPEYMKEINMSGFHYHFIDESRSKGGHVLDFVITSGKIEIDYITNFKMILPTTNSFFKLNLKTGNQKELHQVER